MSKRAGVERPSSLRTQITAGLTIMLLPLVALAVAAVLPLRAVVDSLETAANEATRETLLARLRAELLINEDLAYDAALDGAADPYLEHAAQVDAAFAELRADSPSRRCGCWTTRTTTGNVAGTR